MNMKQIWAIIGIAMLSMAVLDFATAPNKRNLKTVVVRSLPFI
jgi:hypothetical protein